MLDHMLHAIWQVSVALAPWLLLGAALSGVLHVLLPGDFLSRHLTGRLGVLKAVLFGVPLPLCSCGVIPAGLGLRRDGASPGASVGFLIATPQTGVDSVVVSASMLGLPFALFKVVAAAVTGIVGGVATDLWASADDDLGPATTGGASSGRRTFRDGLHHCLTVLQSIWGWVLFGIIASAALEVLVPAEVWTRVSTWSPTLSMLAALAISLPLYVCATASVPIAATLVAGGMPAGAALVFLMAGPATNVATIGAIRKGLGLRATVIYLVTVIVFSLGLGALFDGLLSGQTVAMPAHQHGDTGPIVVALTVAFWLLMTYFGWSDARDHIRSRAAVAGAHPDGAAQARGGAILELEVSGMTCQGCVRKLQRTLDSDAEVTHAQVTLEPQRARVGGVSLSKARQLVADAGYQVIDDAAE